MGYDDAINVILRNKTLKNLHSTAQWNPNTHLSRLTHTITPTCSLRTRRSSQPPCHHAPAEKLWEAQERRAPFNYIQHVINGVRLADTPYGIVANVINAVQLHPTRTRSCARAPHAPARADGGRCSCTCTSWTAWHFRSPSPTRSTTRRASPLEMIHLHALGRDRDPLGRDERRHVVRH